MKINQININKLEPYENNPRDNESAVGAVAESIKQFGFKVPIVIDANNVIIAGHTRHKAAQKLGLETVPCIIADDLTDAQIKAFRLIDNKTAELATWDENKLKEEYEKLEAMQEVLQEIGFDDFTPQIEENNPGSEEDDTALTLTLTLCEEQYQICVKVIENRKDHIKHDFGNKSKKSNSLFEAVYLQAKKEQII